MKNLRQVFLGIIIALASIGLLLGGFSLSLAEGKHCTATLTPTHTLTPTSSPTFPPSQPFTPPTAFSHADSPTLTSHLTPT